MGRRPPLGQAANHVDPGPGRDRGRLRAPPARDPRSHRRPDPPRGGGGCAGRRRPHASTTSTATSAPATRPASGRCRWRSTWAWRRATSTRTETGGCSYLVHVGHAADAIAAGKCRVALITLAGRPAQRQAPAPGGAQRIHRQPGGGFEQAGDLAPVGNYAPGGAAAHARVRHHERAARVDQGGGVRARPAQPERDAARPWSRSRTCSTRRWSPTRSIASTAAWSPTAAARSSSSSPTWRRAWSGRRCDGARPRRGRQARRRAAAST